MFRWRRKVLSTRSGSSRRRRPLLTKMQTSWPPTALWRMAAGTAEPTPPGGGQSTRGRPPHAGAGGTPGGQGGRQPLEALAGGVTLVEDGVAVPALSGGGDATAE